MPALWFLVPGRLDTPTGGYAYDRRTVDGLRAHGWSVTVRELDDSFPAPSREALAAAAETLAAIPGNALVIVDGLAYGAMPDVLAGEAARLRLVPLVHHPLAAETGIAADAAARLEAAERLALTFARAVIVTSAATASAVAAYGVDTSRIIVVEPGTEPAPPARGSSGSPPELLCVATLIPRKGHDTLVSALATLTHLPWHLTCVGSLTRDPRTAARIAAEVRDRGMQDRVSLTGDVDEAGVAACYDRADVFVLPTVYEGYGMVVAEALARGLPVVSTATGAIRELVGGDAGVLVPAGDAAALAEALERVLSDDGFRERLAEGARRARGRLPTMEMAAERMRAALAQVEADGRVQR